jgi:hypothetical protein
MNLVGNSIKQFNNNSHISAPELLLYIKKYNE